MAKTRKQYIDEHGGDSYSFSLVDEATVKRLQREGDIKLPKKKVNIPKDEQWNTKVMSSRLLQGIQNGDSIGKIADSLISIVGSNKAVSVRAAKTMVTGAENVGRLDSYKNLSEQGVVMKKVWIATSDDRVRESHEEIDDEEVDVDEPFSNGLMYPGDPDGDPSEVYNCRCSMKTHIVGFKKSDGSISEVEDVSEMKEEVETNETKESIVKIPEEVKEDIQEYVDGTGEDFINSVDEETIKFVKENVEDSTKTFYRVEQSRFTADKVKEGDEFTFKDDIRSFSSSEDSMYEILNQSEEMDHVHEYVVFETTGDVKHFPVDKYIDHNEFLNQHESLLDGEFKVVSKYRDDNDDTLHVIIKQIRR